MSELTQEEIERLPDLLHEMESRLHFGGDPEDTRPSTEVWSELWFCDADYLAVFKAARLGLIRGQERVESSAPVSPRHPSCVSDPDAPDGLSSYVEVTR